MKILVLSDSHASLQLMRRFVKLVKPNAIVHLGDHFDDGQAIGEENPGIPLYALPGNCDRYRCPPFTPEVCTLRVCGVPLYMTHGHLHHVKLGIGGLLADARRAGVCGVLYGHTHRPDCHREDDGLWVLNPGSCGHGGGTAGILETDGKTITACYLIGQTELEELV